MIASIPWLHLNFETLRAYGVPAALFGFLLWRLGRFYLVRRQLPSLMAQGGVIVDVRSPGEFAAGSNRASINIPLNLLETRAKRLNPEKPVILCCASGTRSGMAASILKRQGFKKVINAGPWKNATFPG